MKKITKLLVGTLCAVSLLMAPAAFADDVATPVPAESWVLSLGGVGSTVTSGDTETVAGVNLSVGRYGEVILPVEFGLRQSVAYDGDDTLLTTAVYNDWTLFTVKKVNLDLFVGGNVSLTYGNTKPEWSIAPEGGLRWWVKDDVAVLARIEAPFDLDGWEFRDTLSYTVGFQVKF